MGTGEVIVLLAVVVMLTLIGWMRARLLARRLEERAADTEQRLADAERRATEADERAGEAERKAEEHAERTERERRLAQRTEQARQTEHDWNRELRREISKLRAEQGVLGRGDDIRSLVLAIAMRLVEARKGVLLTRSDSDGDGELDMVASEGFESESEASEAAQPWAHRVLERDEMVREDDVIGIPVYIADEFHGVVVCGDRQGGFEELDDEVLLALGDQAGAVLENTRLHGELRDAYVTTVQLLADALEAKDPFLRLHSDEVCSYVEAVLEKLDVDRREREEMVFASLLHDVGKIGISERILLKPGRLTPEERSVIELHPQIGYRMIEKVPALRSMTAGILHHHERWDGDGYPSGLSGEEIPLEARVICVADCFSAMTSDRPYRKGMSVEDACAELERNAGTQFDPKVVRLFVEEVREREPEERPPLGTLADAFDDPEIVSRRKPGEPLLGTAQAALVDPVTLLYTRRRLHELAAAEAERAAVQGTSFAVVHATLDGVAEVNREHGWAAGDELLQTAGRAMEELATSANATAFRDSGCSFALLIPQSGRAEAEPVASTVAQLLADRGLTVRVGLAVWREGLTGEEIILGAAAPAAVPAS